MDAQVPRLAEERPWFPETLPWVPTSPTPAPSRRDFPFGGRSNQFPSDQWAQSDDDDESDPWLRAYYGLDQQGDRHMEHQFSDPEEEGSEDDLGNLSESERAVILFLRQRSAQDQPEQPPMLQKENRTTAPVHSVPPAHMAAPPALPRQTAPGHVTGTRRSSAIDPQPAYANVGVQDLSDRSRLTQVVHTLASAPAPPPSPEHEGLSMAAKNALVSALHHLPAVETDRETLVSLSRRHVDPKVRGEDKEHLPTTPYQLYWIQKLVNRLQGSEWPSLGESYDPSKLALKPESQRTNPPMSHQEYFLPQYLMPTTTGDDVSDKGKRQKRLYGSTARWSFELSSADKEDSQRKQLGLPSTLPRAISVPTLVVNDCEATLKVALILLARQEFLSNTSRELLQLLACGDQTSTEAKFAMDEIFEDLGRDTERLNRQVLLSLANLQLVRRDAVLSELTASTAAKDYLRQAPLFGHSLFAHHLQPCLDHNWSQAQVQVYTPPTRHQSVTPSWQIRQEESWHSHAPRKSPGASRAKSPRRRKRQAPKVFSQGGKRHKPTSPQVGTHQQQASQAQKQSRGRFRGRGRSSRK